jgi:hypothetical protein
MAAHATRLEDGEVGRWVGGSLLRLRSRPGREGGVFQRTGSGPAAPTGLFRVASALSWICVTESAFDGGCGDTNSDDAESTIGVSPGGALTAHIQHA